MRKNLLTCVCVGLLLGAAGRMSAQSTSTILTFSVDMATNLAGGTFNPPPPGGTGTDVVDVRGAFNGWAPLVLVEQGSSPVWTNSYNASNPLGTTIDYKFYLNGNGETTACYDNRTLMLPTLNGTSVIVPTHFFSDIGPGITVTNTFQIDMSEEIELGHFHPASGDTVVVAGSFNGWSTTAGTQWVLTNNPGILVTNNNFTPPVVEHNVYTVTTPITQCASEPGLPAVNSSQDFKYVEMPAGNWETSSSADSNDNGNRWFTETGNQTLPLIGFSDTPYAPLATVTLNVDMSAVAQSDANFVPNSLTAWGTFNSWSGPLTLTNKPVGSNTNLYTATVSMGEGVGYILQYRYTNSYTGGWVFDYAQDGGPNAANNNNYRRIIEMPVTATVLVTNVPTVYFNDLAPDDLLPAATAVQFSVEMTTNTVGTDGHAFIPGTDGVYINGMFAGATPSEPVNGVAQSWYPWVGGVNINSAPGGFQMIQQGASTLYTNTIILPAGTPVALSYQYGMDVDSFYGGPVEDEAPSASVHYRVVRATASGTYVMPTDTFTNQPYVEPFFSTGNIGGNGNLAGGNLTVGKAVSGRVPVTWLGRPGAHLQTASALSGGTWQDLAATDGTNWTTGSSTANGFVSQTNWPAGGKAFFRLVKP